MQPDHSVQEVEGLQQRVDALERALAATEECRRSGMEAAAAASEEREIKVPPSCLVCGFWKCMGLHFSEAWQGF